MKRMFIDQIFPNIIGAKAPLKQVIEQHCRAFGVPGETALALNTILPPNLGNAWCFLDKAHDFWRYEFGEPLMLNGSTQALWGTHMWVAVGDLLQGLIAVSNHVPLGKARAYLTRLDDAAKHRDVLCEMMPVVRLIEGAATDFEIEGRGNGNTTIDWSIMPTGQREVLIDVKTRIADLIHQMERPETGKVMPAPTHDAAMMFRSVENKFLPVDRAERLQGAWVTTHIKQEASEIEAAFNALDGSKIHFTVFGEWEPGAMILVRDESDRTYIKEVFGIEGDGAFMFTRP